MKITILEPYFTGSHRAWAKGYAAHSAHDIDIITMPGRFWKWRMHGGAVTIAREFLAGGEVPDLILAGSMLDLSSFLALTRNTTAGVPAAVYFHENQLAYPWQERDRDRQRGRDVHYGFINYITALCADRIFFNSYYNMSSFLEELPRMLKHFPDCNELESVDEIAARSSVLHLGIEFPEPQGTASLSGLRHDLPVIMWNHRWEYDKNPAAFFNALIALDQQNLDFRVILLGESFRQKPEEFTRAIDILGEKIIHAGFVESRAEYAFWLSCGNLLPVTSIHDFFGVSVCEAIWCGCFPILPRRLAYPELVPEEFHQRVFYDTDEDFYRMLAWTVTNWDRMRGERMETVRGLMDAMRCFSWTGMAPVYDKIFSEILND